MNFKINEKVLQDVLNYLATRPYVEVYQFLAILTRLEKIEEVNAEAPKEAKDKTEVPKKEVKEKGDNKKK